MKQFLYAIHQHSEKRIDTHFKVTFGFKYIIKATHTYMYRWAERHMSLAQRLKLHNLNNNFIKWNRGVHWYTIQWIYTSDTLPTKLSTPAS